MNYRLVSERPEHAGAIEGVLDRAFGPGRLAKTSERVRERGAVFEPSFSRVALGDDARVIGCCRIWRVEANGRPALFLGPLAVDPTVQKNGLGAALVSECVRACRAGGARAVILVGAAEFFGPLGFSLIPEGRLTLPGPVDPARFLWMELVAGALDSLAGAVVAPAQ